jgi:hypothetical protein
MLQSKKKKEEKGKQKQKEWAQFAQGVSKWGERE